MNEPITQSTKTTQSERIYYLDNLRSFMIFLVVFYHAGIVYESSGVGASFWIVDDPSTNDFSGLLNLVLDIFIMPTMFFVSGFLTPLSVERKGTLGFLRSKFMRLIVPWLLAVFTMIPLYKVLFLHSRGLPQESWTSYFHFSNGILSQSWLWFLPVLFLFDLAYGFLSKVKLDVSRVTLPMAVSVSGLVGFAYMALMDLGGQRGWTKTAFLDFQNERLPIYFLAFLVGALCLKIRALERPRNEFLFKFVSSMIWLPIMIYICFLLFPWIKPGETLVSRVGDRLILWFSFQLCLVGLMYLMIETFRRTQNKLGEFRAALNQSSYGIYIVHVIVMGVIAGFLIEVALPSLLKHLLLAGVTFALSHALVSAYRRVAPGRGH